jgi:hypothetical protein
MRSLKFIKLLSPHGWICTKPEQMMARLDAYHERMEAMRDISLEKMEACVGKTETMDFEANPEEIESKGEHEDEVPKEEAVVWKLSEH